MTYVAIINTPGNLPDTADPPPEFEHASEAWQYLADERQRHEEDTDPSEYDQGDPDQFELSDTWQTLSYIASGNHTHGNKHEDWPTEADGTGVVRGNTPGRYNDPSDMGIAYCVNLLD